MDNNDKDMEVDGIVCYYKTTSKADEDLPEAKNIQAPLR